MTRAALVAGVVLAVAGPAEKAETEDSRARGLAIVVGAGPAGLKAACLSCHGVEGGGDAATAAPRLDGMSAFYLLKQLRDYATGWRESEAMAPVVKALDARGMADVAAYYAGADAAVAPLGAADGELLALGAAIARRGLPERGAPPCDACHGPEGEGLPPAIPYLAGQHAAYIVAQFNQWKAGQRRNDPLGSMAWLATVLSEQEVRAVAEHYARAR